MKNNTNKSSKNVNTNNENIEANVNEENLDNVNVQEVAAQYNKEENQRKVALICSLMGNIFFLVTAYTILCADGTGRLFGQLLGVNL